MPRPVYRLASETTRRRLASSRWFLARLPSSAIHSRSMRCVRGAARSLPRPASPRRTGPASIRLASSTSCSALSSGTLPICFR